MATIDKSKSQTYDFLSKNKSIEDIKKQEDIEVKEIKNKRHGGKTFRIDNANNQPTNDDLNDLSENNRENLKPLTSNLTNKEQEQEIKSDIWIKFKNYLNWPTSNTEELIQVQKKYIEQLEQSNLEKDKEIEQLKTENQKLKVKQSNVNLTKFSYNAIIIYDEKQRKKTGIEKIHEEILPIEDKIIFITTFVHIDNSITEKIMHFQQLTNGNIEVIKQLKKYENINEYKNDLLLIEANSNPEKNIKVDPIPIKDYLKQQQDFKLKPTKIERTLWCIFTVVTLLTVASTLLLLVSPIASISTISITIKAIAGIMSGTRIFAPLFSSTTRKVDTWFGNKLYKNKEQKENEKDNIKSSFKDLTSDKPETNLEKQFKILKQELNNRKNMKPDQLISNSTINHNSNSIIENSNIESENNQAFDSSIRNTVNQQEQQTSTNLNHNWNKVKCLLTK